ncbi:MAG: type III-A CRISPR-associated protein Csm2 [Comamonas sp.]|nr:type III-A CRISPR-associated protein Csm2 [Comamonas sp.]
MALALSAIGFKQPLRTDLFSVVAFDYAQEVFIEGCKNDKGILVQNRDGQPQQQKNKSSQLRRFYDELVMWYERVQFERTPAERQAKYQEVAPFIQMLVAKAAYANGRKHIDDTFEQMFSHVIRQISDADSLRHAKLFMEAFMGFYKAQEK